MEEKLITVGIALHNNQKYIEKCILSVINQTYRNIEVIIVDDGSTDDSVIKAKGFSDDRIIIVQQKNTGLSAVRQKCLELAHGEYICFIDGDDYLKDTYLQILCDGIKAEESDIAVCGTLFVNEQGKEIVDASDAYSFSHTSVVEINDQNLQNNYCCLLNELLMSDSWNKLYRRSFLTNESLKFELPKGYNGTDLIFNHKVLLHKPKIKLLTERLYVHVIYEKSATHRAKKELLNSMLIAMDQIVAEAKSQQIYDALQNQLANLMYLLIRNAVQDDFMENAKHKRVFLANLKKSFVLVNHFEKRVGRLKIKNSISKSLGFFAWAFAAKFDYILLAYFHLRSKYENII